MSPQGRLELSNKFISVNHLGEKSSNQIKTITSYMIMTNCMKKGIKKNSSHLINIVLISHVLIKLRIFMISARAERKDSKLWID